LDTNEHIKYFSELFNTDEKKFIRIFVGSDDDVLFPKNNCATLNKKFVIHFHGYFIPLQGIEYIIKAAHLLRKEDIFFNLIGNGQTYAKAKALSEKLDIKKIEFIDSLPYEKLRDQMSQADICLGIFGNTDKARRVIPNKAYEALAVGRPLITGDSSAIRELFTDRTNVLLSKMANENDLASKIMELKNNADLRNKISDNGYALFKNQLLPQTVVEPLINFLKVQKKL
jgi:glycosyltransferase involved in cell wall biosynthesis